MDTGLGQGLRWTCFGNRMWDGVYVVGGEPSGHKAATGLTGLRNKSGDRGGFSLEWGQNMLGDKGSRYSVICDPTKLGATVNCCVIF